MLGAVLLLPCVSAVFSVYRLDASADSRDALRTLRRRAVELDLDFWKTTDPFWDVMVNSKNSQKMVGWLEKRNVSYVKTIEDVEGLIREREHKPRERKLRDFSSAGYDFGRYGSYLSMQKYMRNIAKRHHLAQYVSIGKSTEGRSIDGLEIGHGRDVVWVDAGMHAREWAAPHTALFFIHQLTRVASDPLHNLTFVIVPCVNPDGYEFSRTSTYPAIRLWRKNRSELVCRRDEWGRSKCCRGVDLNRNFDFHFRESGSSDDPCSEIYQGSEAFSEPETRAVRDAIMSRRYKGRVQAYITLHTYSQIWIHPYGHQKNTYPNDIDDMYNVAIKATEALSKMYGTQYKVGSGADTLYAASGGSEDWAKNTAHIKYTYLIELRPEEENYDGFILDESQLLPTARETWQGVKVVFFSVLQRRRTKRRQRGPRQIV